MTITRNRLRAAFAALSAVSSIAAAHCWEEFGEEQPRDLTAAALTACHLAQIEQCEKAMPGFKEQTRNYVETLKSDPRYIEISKSKDFKTYKEDAGRYLTDHPAKNNCTSLLKALLAK